MMLESSVSKVPTKVLKKEHSYICYEIKMPMELVVGLYLLNEHKEKFTHLIGKYTSESLTQLSKNIYGKKHKPSESCLNCR
jgi:hypothetical protein